MTSRGRAGGERVEQVDALAQHALGADPEAVVLPADVGVGEGGDVRRVDLHVAAAEGGELGDLRLEDPRGVGERVEGVRIGLRRRLRVPPLAEHERTGQRRLRRELGAVAHVRVLLGRDRADAPERRAHRVPRDRPRQVLGAVGVVAVPGRRRRRGPADALDGVEQAAGEDAAAHLAVADDVEPARLLERDRLVDRAVLDGAQVVGRERAGVVCGPGLGEIGRPEQRSDRLRTGSHAATLRPRRPTVEETGSGQRNAAVAEPAARREDCRRWGTTASPSRTSGAWRGPWSCRRSSAPRRTARTTTTRPSRRACATPSPRSCVTRRRSASTS